MMMMTMTLTILINAPNDNDYHELQPQDSNPTIIHPPRSQIRKASQSHAFGILQFLHIC
jgi:hypothetical protein